MSCGKRNQNSQYQYWAQVQSLSYCTHGGQYCIEHQNGHYNNEHQSGHYCIGCQSGHYHFGQQCCH